MAEKLLTYVKTPHILFVPLAVMGLIPLMIFFCTSPKRPSRYSPFWFSMDIYINCFGPRDYSAIHLPDKIFTTLILLFYLNAYFQVVFIIPMAKHMYAALNMFIYILLRMKVSGLSSNWYSKIGKFLPTSTPTLLIPLVIMIKVLNFLMQPIIMSFHLMMSMMLGSMMIFLLHGMLNIMIMNFWFSPTCLIMMIMIIMLMFIVVMMQSFMALLLLVNMYKKKNPQKWQEWLQSWQDWLQSWRKWWQKF